MNVVMVGPFGLRPKGTMSVRALPIAKALSERGHAVTMLLPPWDDPENDGREWYEESVRVVNVPLPPRLPLLFHARLTLRLVRFALALGPDAVYLFKPKAYAGLTHYCLRLLRGIGLAGRGVRLVVDTDDWERAWNDMHDYTPAQKRLFAWQEEWGLRHADAVVTASRALVELAGRLGVPRERVFYAPNGVRQEMSAPPTRLGRAVRVRCGLGDAPVMLLYTRFFDFGLDRLVSILRPVFGSVPEVRLLVVGKGLFDEEDALVGALNSYGVSGRVVFAGWVPQEELPHYFAAADVALFPSDDTPVNLHRCSVKLVDLMAAGLPVVADRVGQNAEYIVDGESGFLVAPGDSAAFASVLVRLLKEPSFRKRVGARARERVLGKFSWAEISQEIEKALCTNTGCSD